MPTTEGETRPGPAQTSGEVRHSAGRTVGRMVPLASIEPDPDQPRRDLGNLDGLTASIRDRGVLEPILARPVDQPGPGGATTPRRYRIISGERRFRAARQAGLAEIPLIEMDVSARDAFEIALVENLQRADLTPFEEAEGLRTLVERQGSTHERAAAAGKEAVELELGPGAFADYAGDFWRILPTRPYMRAVAGLSDLMWDMGEREESIALIREMLRLNPNDNQGMRSYLISKLFALDDLSEVENLLEIYREPDFAEWHWNMALLTFRREGDSADAASILDQAIEVNPFVPKLLTGATPVPVSMPPQYSLGSPEEAISYAFLNGKNWSDTKGALTWVARKTKGK